MYSSIIYENVLLFLSLFLKSFHPNFSSSVFPCLLSLVHHSLVHFYSSLPWCSFFPCSFTFSPSHSMFWVPPLLQNPFCSSSHLPSILKIHSPLIISAWHSSICVSFVSFSPSSSNLDLAFFCRQSSSGIAHSSSLFLMSTPLQKFTSAS